MVDAGDLRIVLRACPRDFGLGRRRQGASPGALP
jgi:hypothetical protein